MWHIICISFTDLKGEALHCQISNKIRIVTFIVKISGQLPIKCKVVNWFANNGIYTHLHTRKNISVHSACLFGHRMIFPLLFLLGFGLHRLLKEMWPFNG